MAYIDLYWFGLILRAWLLHIYLIQVALKVSFYSRGCASLFANIKGPGSSLQAPVLA